LKKLIALVALTLMLGGATAATAAKGENQGKAGPNGNNDHGLCTAYFNGQKNGHEGGSPGPFAALEEHSEENAPKNTDEDDNNDVTGIEAVWDYCNSVAKGIGGNGDENGRFTDCYTDADGDDSNDCTDGDPAPAA
jgi:hypothetical protein